MVDIRRYMENFAADFGVLDMQTPERLPNTRRALGMAEFAREKGKLGVFKDLAMDAHWKEGKDLENDRDLAELATRAGLDPTAAMEATNSHRYLQRVDELRAESYGMGITGIPTFIIGKQRVVGCQPYDTLVSASRNAGVSARKL